MITPVQVYTSGDEAELFLNGKSLGRKAKRAGQDFRLAWNNVSYEPGELKVVTYKAGQPWATEIVKTTGEPEKLKLTADRNNISSDSEDLTFITLKIQDKDGLTVPRSHPLVRFEINGPGEIVATDNGDATSFVPFQSKEREAFNGLALVIVKAHKGAKGSFMVKAYSEGLVSDQLSVEIN
jgi:beta-galactosidase